MNNNDDTKNREEARRQILELIARRRAAECDNGIGASIERRILAEQSGSIESSSLSALSKNLSE